MVFEFNDYRKYLQGELDRRVHNNPSYSLRAFAKTLDMSPSQASLILSGKRDISSDKAIQLAKSLGFSFEESEYFYDLVGYQTAKSLELKEFYHDRLHRRRKESSFASLDLDRFKVISEWYHLAIMELTRLDVFTDSIEWVSQRLGISELDAELAIDRLLRLGLLKRSRDGLVKSKADLVIESVAKFEALRKVHKQFLGLASSAIDRQTTAEREVGSIVFPADPSLIEKVRPMFKKFRRDVMQLMESGERKEVYVVSTQLFRVSNKEGKQ